MNARFFLPIFCRNFRIFVQISGINNALLNKKEIKWVN